MKSLEELTRQSIFFLNNNNFLEAENLLDQLIHQYPSDQNAYVNKTLLLIHKKRFIDAKKIAILAHKKFPKNSQILNAKGICNQQLEIYDEAELNFLKAIDLDKRNYDAHINLSRLYIGLKKYKQALSAINNSLVINSNHIIFNQIRLSTLKLLKRNDDAKIQELILKRVENLNKLFEIEYQNNIKLLEKLTLELKKNKSDFSKLFKKALLFFDLKMYTESLNITENLLETNYKNLEYQKLKIKNLIHLHMLKAALIFIDKNLKISKDSNIIYYKAEIYKALNDQKNFFYSLSKINPDELDYENSFEYSKFLLGENKFKEAWRYFDLRHYTPSYLKYRPKIFKKRINIKKVALLGELGIGDQILFLTCLESFIQKDLNYHVFIDDRLVNIFNKYSIYSKYSNIKFLSEIDYHQENYDQSMFLGDILKFTRNSLSDFISQPKKLIDLNIFSEIKKENKIRVGISWKSKNKKLSKDIKIESILRILNDPKYEVINLQYGDISDLNDASLKLKKEIILNEDIDKYFDFDQLLFLINSCDVILTSSNIIAHFAGILGKSTILLLPKKEDALWYWQSQKEMSYWYPCIKILVVENDFKNIINEMSRFQ